MNELFPALSITMKKCIENKLAEEPDFKIDDFGDDAVQDVIERLKTKRFMNYKEIIYLKELIPRATAYDDNRSYVFIQLDSRWKT